MAAPNIASTSAGYGKTTGMAVTTSAASILTNASGSGKVLKVNSLIVSNINGTAAADITADVYKNQTTAYRLAYIISVPAKATLVVISKDTGIYLEENDSIRLTASANSYLEGVISYEEIS